MRRAAEAAMLAAEALWLTRLPSKLYKTQHQLPFWPTRPHAFRAGRERPIRPGKKIGVFDRIAAASVSH